MTAMVQPHVTLTAAAEKFMRRMVRFSGQPAGGFRLRVVPGGCSGYTSEFTVEAAPTPGDSELFVNGVRMFLPAESRLVLDGVTVDFADTPTQSGLTFFNPNAAAPTCSTSGDVGIPRQAVVPLTSLRRS